MTSLGHHVAFNDPQILAHDNNRFRLGIKETLNIHSYKAYKSLNTNTGSYEIYITEIYYLTVKLAVVLLTLMVYINMISYFYLRLTIPDPHILLKA